jgi:hypothetical protein
MRDEPQRGAHGSVLEVGQVVIYPAHTPTQTKPQDRETRSDEV